MFGSSKSIKTSMSAETWRLQNIYFPDSFPIETRLDRKRGDGLTSEVNGKHQTMTVCVGSTDEWREAGKIGLRAQRLAYISHTHSPMITPSKLFSLLLNGPFLPPVCSMNYVNDEGIPFFPVAKRRKDWSERNASSLFFAPSLTLPVNLSCRQCGPGFSALRPCERMMVAARAEGGGGSAHNDIHEELRRQAGKECWPCCWTAWHWLMREKDREKIRREGWHWYSRPAWGSWTLVRRGERLRKSPRLHCWSGRG